MSILLVMTTFPSHQDAVDVSEIVIANKLAACINIMPPMYSMYTWENKVERTTEVLMMIRTTSDKFQELQQLIKKNHSYVLPEIIAFPVSQGLPEYLSWVSNSITSGSITPGK